MRIKGLLMILLVSVLSVRAAAPQRGADRLRQLVIFPEVNLNFSLTFIFQGDQWELVNAANLPDVAGEAHQALKLRPDDTRQWLRLGFAQDWAGQTNDAWASFKKITQLCQARQETAPADGLNLIYYGYALKQLSQDDKAESMCRKAVEVSPKDWRCWSGLGAFLCKQYTSAMYDAYRHGLSISSDRDAVQNFRPPPEAVARLKALDQEASHCFDQAVALASNDPEVYVQRAGFEAALGYDRSLLGHVLNNQKLDFTLKMTDGLTSTGAVINLQKAAGLPKVTCACIEAAVFAKVVQGLAASADGRDNAIDIQNSRPETWPAETRQFVHEARGRLETISHDPDPILAARALEGMGSVDVLLGSQDSAISVLRRAVSLDPASDGAWDLLLGLVARSHSPDELVAACQQRLAAKNSVRNHLLLARAYLHQQKWDKLDEQARVAAKMDPDSYAAHLDLLAVALRQSVGTNFMSAYSEQYVALQKLARDPKFSDPNGNYWRTSMLDTAIANGLINDPDCQSTARHCVDMVLKYFPGDADAREISDALD